MNKAYLFAIILLAGGVVGCIGASDENEELIDVLGFDDEYVTASKFFVDKFNDALYGAICEKLMYDDGSFYNDNDVSKCVEDGNREYKDEDNGGGSNVTRDNNAIMAPDWEYMEFENTGKQANSTGDIYLVTGPGIFCNKRDDCDGGKFSQFYMAKNINTGEWGYASKGFRTTDGDYLEVINTL